MISTVKRLLKYIFYQPLVLFLTLLVYLLRPFVLIRFLPIVTHRIGHFVGNVEMYFCERDAGMHPKNSLDLVFYAGRNSCNKQLNVMWERVLKGYKLIHPPVLFSGILMRTQSYISKIPSMAVHIVKNSDSDDSRILRLQKVHLAFTDDEERKGREALKSFGLPDNAEFVCIFARDNAYLSTLFPKGNWGYHDYRDADIRNYMDAAVEMTRRGYYVFRMGAVMKTPLPKLNNPMIIDLPFSDKRNDFIDIYLWMKCRFCIASSAGPAVIPLVLRKPTVFVNWLPLPYITHWNDDNLFIPKRLFIRRLNRDASFLEQNLFEALSVNIGWRNSSEYYDTGLEFVENTPREILDVAIEMDDRLKGVHVTGQEDERLQAQFWGMITSLDETQVLGRKFRVGSKYLTDHRGRLG
ncbi:MAG: TIGR04372 family glycosyltransferase [Nitrospinae bacterium]|nr:TIGR04372 family glycosyltransferase [Nitrospinota bacterium]